MTPMKKGDRIALCGIEMTGGVMNRFARPAELTVICSLLAMMLPAAARWKPEYAQLPQSVRDWYQAQELTPAAQKIFHFKSCCAHADVVHTEFRVNKTDGENEI